MSKRKVMTHETHIEVGKNLRMVKHRLMDAVVTVSNNMPKNSIPLRKLEQAQKAINVACDLLDEDWCCDCVPSTPEGDAVFEAHKFPYYGPSGKVK